jgi:hypothetical protein
MMKLYKYKGKPFVDFFPEDLSKNMVEVELSDIKAYLSERGLVAVDKSKMMGWYDVLQEALENPQYDHDCRARRAVKDMMTAAQGEG